MLIRSIKKYHHQTIGYLWGKEALILCPCLQRIPLFVCNLQIEPKVTEIKSTAVLPYIKDHRRVISVRSHVSLGCCFKFVWVRHWRKCIELWKWDRTRQKGRKITLVSRKKNSNQFHRDYLWYVLTEKSISSRAAKGLILVRVFVIRELTTISLVRISRDLSPVWRTLWFPSWNARGLNRQRRLNIIYFLTTYFSYSVVCYCR